MSPRTARRSHQERTQATTRALLDAARERFARDGYAATSMDAVAAEAGVTKGALYHHFENKRDLFEAVYAREERRLGAIMAAAFESERDPWEGMKAGFRAWLDAARDPAVQRITLLDSLGALGWETMRALTPSLRMTEEGLRRAIAAGAISPRPVEPLAHLLFSAGCEAANVIARADDQEAAGRAMWAELRRLLDGIAKA